MATAVMKSEMKKGMPMERAKSVGYATVNKMRSKKKWMSSDGGKMKA